MHACRTRHSTCWLCSMQALQHADCLSRRHTASILGFEAISLNPKQSSLKTVLGAWSQGSRQATTHITFSRKPTAVNSCSCHFEQHTRGCSLTFCICSTCCTAGSILHKNLAVVASNVVGCGGGWRRLGWGRRRLGVGLGPSQEAATGDGTITASGSATCVAVPTGSANSNLVSTEHIDATCTGTEKI